MAVVLEIVERVGPAVLTFALGRATPRIVAEVKGHHARRFWAPVAKTDTDIVLGRHVHPEWEPSGLLGLGDARALAELRRHLRRLYIAEPEVVYDDQLAGRDLAHSSLIMLGGPFSNALIRDLWESLELSWRFEYASPDEFAIIDERTGEQHLPQRDDDGNVTRDHGLLVKTRNPAGSDQRFTLFAFCGCFGYGTHAALRYATYDRFLKASLVGGGHDVEALITTTVSSGAPQRVSAIDVRRIAVARQVVRR